MTQIIETDVVSPTARAAQSRPTTFAALWLLVRRRMWRDRGLVIGSAIIVTLAILMAYAGPLLVMRTIDTGARDAVAGAGPAADIILSFPVGNTTGDNVTSTPGSAPGTFFDDAAATVDYLSPRLAEMASVNDAWASSRAFTIERVITEAQRDSHDAESGELLGSPRPNDRLSVALLDGAQLSVSEGRAPSEPGPVQVVNVESIEDVDPDDYEGSIEIFTRLDGSVGVRVTPLVEFALHPDVADVLDLQLGDTVVLEYQESLAEATLVGFVEPVDPDHPAWARAPEALVATVADNPTQPLMRRGTAIVSPAAADALTSRLGAPMTGTVVLGLRADALTLATIPAIADDVADLRRTPGTLVPDSQVSATITTALDSTLLDYPPRARAALAQMSVVVAGVVAVAAAVIALMAQLLLTRRSRDIALERARGASVASVGARLATESVLVTAAGLTAAWYITTTWVGEVTIADPSALAVVVVSILASPIVGMRLATRMWAGKREPANRGDRAKRRAAARAKRLTLDALALTLAVLAVVALRQRGVTQTQTDGVDLFLSAAPVLLALGVTVLTIRLYPLPMALIQAIARRTRGVTGAITLARARSPIPALPLLALTLAIAVGVGGTLLVSTVRSGQDQASWERIGAQARIDAEADPVVVDQLSEQGNTVAVLHTQTGAQIVLGRLYETTTVLAYSAAYADILDESGLADSAQLRELSAQMEHWEPGAPIPALASSSLLDLSFTETASVYISSERVTVTFVGEATVVPAGWLPDSPYVVLPWEALEDIETATEIRPTLVMVGGGAAQQAVADHPLVDATTVNTRGQWLAMVRDSALIGGVERIMSVAVAGVGLLALVALLVTVVQGVRQRGHTLVMLRTQGMHNRYGWWLAFTELAPLVVAAVLGGAVAGVVMVTLLGSALGLDVLAGGLSQPPIDVNPTWLGIIAAGVGVMLIAAIWAEVLAHRRHKLSEVLRQGEAG